jgi:ERCC4-type nuclease
VTAKLLVIVDTREQMPFDLLPGVEMVRATLDAGDYTTVALQGIAVIERKSVADFASSITHERERFDDELRRLRGYRWRCIIVEGEIGEVWRAAAVHPHSVIGTCASFMARSDCPVLFAGTRAAAARLAFGILRRWEERLAAEGGQAA